MSTENYILTTNTGKADADTESKLLQLCRSVTEYSPLAMVAAEGEAHLVCYVNPAFCRLAGKEREELLGHPFTEIVPEGEENGCKALLDRVYSTGVAENLADQPHAALHANPIYWSYAVWAILTAKEHPTGVMLQVTDTTATAIFRRQVTAMNEQLVLSDVRQHGLTETAEALNARLQRAMLETDHRVKNNLQAVSALAEMQIDEDSPTVPTSALQRIVTHVRTLAALHDILTQKARPHAEDATLSTEVALDSLMPLLQTNVGSRRLRYEIAPVALSPNKSASLSLLVSELVNNALKHGAGDITIELLRAGAEARLVVRDEGKGFPEGFDPRTAAHTGLDLVLDIAPLDLRGEVAFTNHPEGGGCVTITFPISQESYSVMDISHLH
jgi:PAS domain S-box-containing protein